MEVPRRETEAIPSQNRRGGKLNRAATVRPIALLPLLLAGPFFFGNMPIRLLSRMRHGQQFIPSKVECRRLSIAVLVLIGTLDRRILMFGLERLWRPFFGYVGRRWPLVPRPPLSAECVEARPHALARENMPTTFASGALGILGCSPFIVSLIT